MLVHFVTVCSSMRKLNVFIYFASKVNKIDPHLLVPTGLVRTFLSKTKTTLENVLTSTSTNLINKVVISVI